MPEEAARGAARLEAVASRHCKDLDTILLQSTHRLNLVQQQAKTTIAEAGMDAASPAADGVADLQERLATTAQQAIVACAAEALERVADLSLHALGELSAAAVAQLLTLERELAGAAPGGASAQAVLVETAPLRSAAVRCALAAAPSGRLGPPALTLAVRRALPTPLPGTWPRSPSRP